MVTGSRGVRGSTPLFLDSSRSGRGAHGPEPAGGRSRERGEYKGETGPDSSRGREVVESDCLASMYVEARCLVEEVLLTLASRMFGPWSRV